MSVAPPLGKELASTDKKTRDDAVKGLAKFLRTTSNKPMSDLEMAKLWKGIFYCFWLSDKPLVQQELAASLADLLLTMTSSPASFHFLRGFWEAMVREWSGLDYLRIDKYYLLVRKFVNASFRLLIREKWSKSALEEYENILAGKGGPLYPEDRRIPSGLGYHLADIYNEELDKAMGTTETALPVPLVPLTTPFFKLNALSPSPVTHKRLHGSLFDPLFKALLAHAMPSDSVPNYRSTTSGSALSRDGDGQRRKRARVEPPPPPLPSICTNACLQYDENEESEGDNDASAGPKPLTPKELREGLLKAMFEIASGEDTKEVSRKRMYRAWKEASEQAEDAHIDSNI
ncbi:hypothetical protein FRB91_010957 [Serendipita sp. 411]|nr:hypothetical protein FRB91_010957 [Serendipita sp. 411]